MRALVVVPTYGRLPFLGRLLSSFIAQTYDDKHMVIINDDKNIEIRCDRPDVTVLNLTQRINIAEKRNLGAVFGTYDIIMPWDDDDAFLPMRIANHIEKFKDEAVNAYRNMTSYLVHGSNFTTSNGGFGSLSYRRKEWFRVEGYQWPHGSGEDQELYNKLSGFLKEVDPTKRDFIYNFGGVNYHLSCDPHKIFIEQKAHEQLVQRNIVGGKFYIYPDFEEYNKFLWLDKLYREQEVEQPIPITHVDLGKIDISHLL